MTYTYFKTESQTVKINGVEQECQVVNSITHSSQPISNLTPIPEGYDESIMGKAYIDGEFVEIDREEESAEDFITLSDIDAKLDTIQSGTTQLLTDIRREAVDEYTMELMEGGLL